jgi:integrase
MSRHEQSVAAPALASTVLPSAEVIHLPTARPGTRVAGGFTRVSINKMHCPPGKPEALFWDTACRGFGIRALKSGRRSWIYQYRDEHKRTRRIAIGDVSAVNLDTARAVARRYAANVTQGATETLPVRHEGVEGCVFGRRGNGFSGWSKSKKALEAKLANASQFLKRRTLHDLRRTFSTRLHDAGIEPLVVEALLAHKQHGVAAVYNRASFRDSKRSALMRWHEILRQLMMVV